MTGTPDERAVALIRREAAAVTPAATVPATVNRVAVTADEAAAATLLLDLFNRAEDCSFRAAEWYGMIVRRLREHPDLPVEGHVHVLAWVLRRNRWWSTHATPQVVWGNARLYDSHRQRASRDGRGGVVADAVERVYGAVS